MKKIITCLVLTFLISFTSCKEKDVNIIRNEKGDIEFVNIAIKNIDTIDNVRVRIDNEDNSIWWINYMKDSVKSGPEIFFYYNEGIPLSFENYSNGKKVVGMYDFHFKEDGQLIHGFFTDSVYSYFLEKYKSVNQLKHFHVLDIEADSLVYSIEKDSLGTSVFEEGKLPSNVFINDYGVFIK